MCYTVGNKYAPYLSVIALILSEQVCYFSPSFLDNNLHRSGVPGRFTGPNISYKFAASHEHSHVRRRTNCENFSTLLRKFLVECTEVKTSCAPVDASDGPI